MSHFIVKLVNGDTVYGIVTVDSSDKKIMLVEHPLVWEDYETTDGAYGSALVKYFTGSDEDTIAIPSTAVVSIALMSPVFQKFYESALTIQALSDKAYDDKIRYMTAKMNDLIVEQYAKDLADKTGELVEYSTDLDTTNSTIH